MRATYPQSTLRPRWWETASGILRPYLKAQGVTLADLTGQLDEIQAGGFDTLEIFAPCKGGICYNGLDTLDFYQIDPALGTKADFERLIAEAHKRKMAVIAFINLGYSHENFPAFLGACDDVRQDFDTPEVHWFLWSDTGEDVMGKPLAPHFLNDTHGNWRWSERAGKYFWVKWEGEQGGYHLPQFNFGDPGWQQEVRRITEFWLQTGIDGLVIDAVNWYIGCDWEITRSTMTDPIQAADNQFSQPEGAGGFSDDPVSWIMQGGFNCIMDYSIKLWWEGVDIIRDAVLTGDPRPIEATLRGYRDRVVAAGGICYIDTPDLRHESLAAQTLGAAVVATVGELYLQHGESDQHWTDELRHEIKALLNIRQACPALCAGGSRNLCNTSDDSKYYAFIRRLGTELPVLVVMNFQADQQNLIVDLSGVPERRLKDIPTGGEHPRLDRFELTLPGYGFGLWALMP
jgi:glycosidase